jgi:hypothetical protein
MRTFSLCAQCITPDCLIHHAFESRAANWGAHNICQVEIFFLVSIYLTFYVFIIILGQFWNGPKCTHNIKYKKAQVNYLFVYIHAPFITWLQCHFSYFLDWSIVNLKKNILNTSSYLWGSYFMQHWWNYSCILWSMTWIDGVNIQIYYAFPRRW